MLMMIRNDLRLNSRNSAHHRTTNAMAISGNRITD